MVLMPARGKGPVLGSAPLIQTSAPLPWTTTWSAASAEMRRSPDGSTVEVTAVRSRLSSRTSVGERRRSGRRPAGPSPAGLRLAPRLTGINALRTTGLRRSDPAGYIGASSGPHDYDS